MDWWGGRGRTNFSSKRVKLMAKKKITNIMETYMIYIQRYK